MRTNDFLPHLLVLPEDDKDRQLANGFLLEVDFIRQRQMQVLPIAKGWHKVLECFQSDHLKDMRRLPQRYMILLIDFDEREDRYGLARTAIPDDVADRVFILGAWGEPEDLQKAGLGFPETIGMALAKDCREDTNLIWGHELLKHNASELERLRIHLRPLFF